MHSHIFQSRLTYYFLIALLIVSIGSPVYSADDRIFSISTGKQVLNAEEEIRHGTRLTTEDFNGEANSNGVSSANFRLNSQYILSQPFEEEAVGGMLSPSLVNKFYQCLTRGEDIGAAALLHRHPELPNNNYISSGPHKGLTITQVAAFHGNIEVVKHITRINRELIYQKDRNQSKILWHAVINNHLNIVEFLCLNFPGLLQERDDDGSTILHTAASQGHLEVFKFLANNFPGLLQERDYQGCTAAHIAAYDGRLSIIEFLIKDFPTFTGNEINGYGYTVLHCLCSYQSQDLSFSRDSTRTFVLLCLLYPEALKKTTTEALIISSNLIDPTLDMIDLPSGSTPAEIAQLTGETDIAGFLRGLEGFDLSSFQTRSKLLKRYQLA